MTTTRHSSEAAAVAAELPELLRYGQCRAVCLRFGVKERTFRKLMETGQIPKRQFAGDARAYYERDGLLNILKPATTTQPHTTT